MPTKQYLNNRYFHCMLSFNPSGPALVVLLQAKIPLTGHLNVNLNKQITVRSVCYICTPNTWDFSFFKILVQGIFI